MLSLNIRQWFCFCCCNGCQWSIRSNHQICVKWRENQNVVIFYVFNMDFHLRHFARCLVSSVFPLVVLNLSSNCQHVVDSGFTSLFNHREKILQIFNYVTNRGQNWGSTDMHCLITLIKTHLFNIFDIKTYVMIEDVCQLTYKYM